MEGYHAKPIDVDELVATVERVEPTNAPAAAPAPASAGSEPSAIFDERLALAHTGGDRELLRQLAAMFRTDAAAALRRIKRALDARDGEALRMSAHSLKGSLAAVGSPAGRAAAAELEACGRDGQFDTAARVFPLLGDRVKALLNEFATAGLIARAPRRQIKTAPARATRRTTRRPAASRHVTKRGRR
jgi:HPt (histidine-containing phosphotransfer) domain-containing protein